jgi:hypothetical protein
MEESARKARNTQRMTTLYPAFAARLAKAIQQLEAQGVRPRIQDAWRSPADQLAAFNAGNSKLKYGFHNVTAANGAPEALAVDLLDDNAPLNPGKPYMLKLAAAAAAAGLATGVRWGLPAAHRVAVDEAIAAQDWKAAVKVGWDPLHVEPIGITVQQAKQGKRPI